MQRYKVPVPDQYTVTNFDAFGDGVVDDTGAIQRAIDRAKINGGRVIIPTGTYLVSSPLTIDCAVDIDGIGTVKVAPGFSGTTVLTVSAAGCKITGIIIDGSTDEDAGYYSSAVDGITCQADNITIENVTIKNMGGNGVVVEQYSGLTTAGITIRDNELTANHKDGVAVTSAKRLLIADNHITDTNGVGISLRAEIDGGELHGITVSKNIVYSTLPYTWTAGAGDAPAVPEGVYHGRSFEIFVDKDEDVTCSGFLIEGNTFQHELSVEEHGNTVKNMPVFVCAVSPHDENPYYDSAGHGDVSFMNNTVRSNILTESYGTGGLDGRFGMVTVWGNTRWRSEGNLIEGSDTRMDRGGGSRRWNTYAGMYFLGHYDTMLGYVNQPIIKDTVRGFFRYGIAFIGCRMLDLDCKIKITESYIDDTLKTGNAALLLMGDGEIYKSVVGGKVRGTFHGGRASVMMRTMAGVSFDGCFFSPTLVSDGDNDTPYPQYEGLQLGAEASFDEGELVKDVLITDCNVRAGSIVVHGGTNYKCIRSNRGVAGAAGNEPGVATAWDHYWEVVSEVYYLPQAWHSLCGYVSEESIKSWNIHGYRVSSGGVNYMCVRSHTSAASNRPGIGADWEQYWIVDDLWADVGNATIWKGAWANATAYLGHKYLCLATHDSTESSGGGAAGNEPGSVPGDATYWEPDTYVTHGGHTYRCVATHTKDADVTPGTAAGGWFWMEDDTIPAAGLPTWTAFAGTAYGVSFDPLAWEKARAYGDGKGFQGGAGYRVPFGGIASDGGGVLTPVNIMEVGTSKVDLPYMDIRSS